MKKERLVNVDLHCMDCGVGGYVNAETGNVYEQAIDLPASILKNVRRAKCSKCGGRLKATVLHDERVYLRLETEAPRPELRRNR